MTYRKEEAGGPHKCGLSASSFYRKNLGRLCKKYIDTAGMLCYNINCINVEYYTSWAGEAEMKSKGILALTLALVLLCTQMLPAFAQTLPEAETPSAAAQELDASAQETTGEGADLLQEVLPQEKAASLESSAVSYPAMLDTAGPCTLTLVVPDGITEISYAKGNKKASRTQLTIIDGTCSISGLTAGNSNDKLYIFPKLKEGVAFRDNSSAGVDEKGNTFGYTPPTPDGSSGGYIYISYNAFHSNMRVELLLEDNGWSDLEDAPAFFGINDVHVRSQWAWQNVDGVLIPGNSGVQKSLSVLKVAVDAAGLFAFEYATSTEQGADCLLYRVGSELTLDTVPSADNYDARGEFSGRRSWSTAFVPVGEGDTVYLAYYKDVSEIHDVGEDTVWLRNLRVVSGVQPVSIYAADSPDYDLTSPGGTVTVSDNWSGGKVDVQETVSVSAHPAEGYDFLGWTRLVGGRWVMYDAAPDATFFVTGPDTYRALFARPNTYVAQNDGAFYEDLSTALSEAEVGNLVVLLQDAVLSQNAEVKSGVTLLIPFDREKTLYTIKPEASMDDWEMPYPYCTLTLADGVTLTVSGELSLGSRISACGQEAGSHNGTPTGPYGAIVTGNDSRVQVTDGGSLYAWGYLSGDGTVEALSGAKVYECFQIADFRGGSRSMDAFDAGSVPLIQYYVQNIETPLVMHAGAGETVCGAVSVTKDGVTSAQSASTVLIGPGGLFIPGEGGTVTKRYDAASDRIIFEADGKMTFSYMRLSISGFFTETQSYILPLCPNYTLHVCSGETTVTQNTLLLPGAEVTVDAGAVLTVAEDTDVYVARRGTASIPIHPMAYTVAQRGTDRTWASTGDAHLHVSGQVEVRGGLYVTEDGEDDSPLVTGADGGLLSFTRVATDRASAKYSPSGSDVVSRSVVSLARTLYASAASGCQFRRYCGDWCRSVPDADGYRLAVSAPGFVTRWVAVADGKEPPAAVVLTATGNVNGDAAQQLDVTDMACLFTYLSTGLRQGELRRDPVYFAAVADVNQDGVVNILDYQTLYQRLLAAPVS